MPIVGDPARDEGGAYDVAVVAAQLDARLAPSEDVLGFEFIPNAALLGGDFVILDYRLNRRKPQIAIWFHDTSDEFSPDTSVISNDFESFYNSLP
ncbi:MAG: hypothetical protein ACK5KM_02985 [Hyphomicrobiaceae bacterium]